jgi:CHAT domain-containing protein
MLLNQARAEELHSLVTLERDAPPGTERLGLKMLFERKATLLDRQARGLAAVRRAADITPEPAARRSATDVIGGAVGGLIGEIFDGAGTARRRAEAAMARHYQEIQNQQDLSYRDRSRELLRRAERAQADRAALQQRRTVTEDEVRERDRAIAQADLQLEEIGRELSRYAGGQPPRIDIRREIERAKVGTEDRIAQEMTRRDRERDALQSEVRASIPAGAALVEMLLYRPLAPRPRGPGAAGMPLRYAAYVVRRGASEAFVDLGEAEPMDRLVVNLRRSYARPESRAGAMDAARRLDARLMQPLRAALGDTTQVLLAPEGLLNLVPFGALVDEAGRFLIERYEFNYLASGRDLPRMAGTPAPARGPPLIVGDPAFGPAGRPVASADIHSASSPSPRSRDFGGVSFEPLPGTAAEASAIRQLVPGATLLSGNAATESAVKAARGPRLLHLATHGFFLEESPRPRLGSPPGEDALLRSGLVFAGVNGLRSGQDDGVLTALEAGGLDLAGTQLVVLSACETGLGEVRNGEGVFGLRRAFVVAGAETLVMSLWEVDDDTTQRMMVDYYRRLAKGDGRIEALRQAQLALRADPRSSHPFFWAGFIASGQDGPIRWR